MSKFKKEEKRKKLAESTTTAPKKVRGHKARLGKYEAQERRQKVARLRLQGLSHKAIGSVLGISHKIVSADLKAVRDQNRQKLESFDQNETVAGILDTLSEVERRGWNEFASAGEGTPHRLRSLDLIRTLQGDKLKALQDCGLIRKEPLKVEINHKFSLPWDDETQERVARTLLQSALPSDLLEPELDQHDVIDIEPEPGEEEPEL